MEYSHPDDELVKQPIGYWGWAAQNAVVTYIRAGLAEFDVTQPQWWVLAQLATSEGGTKTREEVSTVLHGYLAVGSTLQPEIDALLDRKLITDDGGGRLRLTKEGDVVYRTCAERQTAMRAQVHDGIPDTEYVTTLKVLQRMIHNVGGKAWHH
jgi:MarR family transcriptional regulator, organic hydroperoxide resistance regulator